MQDYAHELCIHFQREVTVTETTHSSPVVLPEALMDAISAWQCIKSDDEARVVGKRIQDWIDGKSLCNSDQNILTQKRRHYFKTR